jgi:hypothetical protein
MADANHFVEFLRRYRDDPVLFVKEVFGVTPDPWQGEMMEAVASGTRKISVKSGHGVGKSSASSWMMLWYLLTRYPVKVVVTAPTSAQLYDALFAECRRWVNEMPEQLKALLVVKSDRIELAAAPAEAFISCRVSRVETPEALQGIHSDNVLLCADEASGVPEAVFIASSGSMSGKNATTLLLGNPTRGSGYFFDTHNKLKSDWWTRTVNCEDSPRVSDEYVEEMRKRFGAESNEWRVRVLGEFPVSDDDTCIPWHLVDSAMDREVPDRDDGQAIWGLDVARMGDDQSALCKRVGRVVSEIQTWKKLDLMQLCGVVKAEYDALPPSRQPQSIIIDSVALGSGVLDRLQELNLPAIGCNVSESPSAGSQYANLRAELWHGKLRAFLEARDCRLPRNDELMAELVAPRYSFTSNGKLRIESKSDLKRRGHKSPDMADAIVLSLAYENTVMMHGSAASNRWKKPIRRNLRGLKVA